MYIYSHGKLVNSYKYTYGAVQLRRRCFLWGGHVQDFSEGGRSRPTSTIVMIFDPYLETWELGARHNRSTTSWTVHWSLHLTVGFIVLVWWNRIHISFMYMLIAIIMVTSIVTSQDVQKQFTMLPNFIATSWQ